jgi:CheY-like chemotaxis protein
MDNKSVTILLAEDDPGHARLIEKNLRRALIYNELIHVGTGRQALDFIFREGAWEGQERPFPLLVLLDLNMPVMDGFQVLERMKQDEESRLIPVIILTTTNDPREIKRCYELGCNIYVTKPVDYEQFTTAIRNLGLMLSIIKVPNDF